MSDSHRRYADVIKEKAAEREAGFTHHPSMEELALYLDDQLATKQDRLIAEHLTYCRSCNQTLVYLREPLEVAWDPSARLDPKRFPVRTPKIKGRWRAHLIWAALAAALLLALLVPPEQSNSQPYYLRLHLSEIRGNTVTVALPEARSGLLVHVDGPNQMPYDAYFMELELVGGKIQRLDDLQQEPGPRFLRLVPRDLLTSQDQELRLLGQNHGESAVVLARWYLRLSEH